MPPASRITPDYGVDGAAAFAQKPQRRMDGPATHRNLRRGNGKLHPPRPRHCLWRTFHPVTSCRGHSRPANCAPLAMAEWSCSGHRAHFSDSNSLRITPSPGTADRHLIFRHAPRFGNLRSRYMTASFSDRRRLFAGLCKSVKYNYTVTTYVQDKY